MKAFFCDTHFARFFEVTEYQFFEKFISFYKTKKIATKSI